jgi:hypothetical protein
MAGFAVAFAGFAFFLYTANLSTWALANEPSYVGGIRIAPSPESEPETGLNPDHVYFDGDETPFNPYLGIFALIAIALLAGATAARIGEPASALRAGAAVFAGVLGFLAWILARSGQPTVHWPEVLAAFMVALVAGAFGLVGGVIVRKLAT